MMLISMIHNHSYSDPSVNLVPTRYPSGREPGDQKGDVPQARGITDLFFNQNPPPRFFIFFGGDKTEYDGKGVKK